MSVADIINGCFELGGAFFIVGHIIKLHKDKLVRGIYWPATAWFAAWGYWNIYYYWSLDQTFSWIAGIGVTVTNSIWLGQILYYTAAEKARLLKTKKQEAAEKLALGPNLWRVVEALKRAKT